MSKLIASFESVKEYVYPSGSVYVMYNRENDFYIETTSMQDVDTRNKSQEVIMSDDPEMIKRCLVPKEEKWLIAISTQFGCPQKCQFCLVPTLGFMGKKLFFIFCADGAIHKLVKEVLIGFTGHGMRLLS